MCEITATPTHGDFCFIDSSPEEGVVILNSKGKSMKDCVVKCLISIFNVKKLEHLD